MTGYALKRSPTHPGEILKQDFLVPLGLTQVQLAKTLKTSFRTIDVILNEKRSVSPDMALRLARYFGTSPDVWIGMQADYDLYWARTKSKKAIDEIKPLIKSKAAK
ncbi:MAG: HigA family addiction module antitoxin [Nitrospirota bacterium]